MPTKRSGSISPNKIVSTAEDSDKTVLDALEQQLERHHDFQHNGIYGVTPSSD